MQLCFNTILVLSIAAILSHMVAMCCYPSSVLPSDMGDFNLSSLHDYVQLQVEGPTEAAAADPVASSAGSANPILC